MGMLCCALRKRLAEIESDGREEKQGGFAGGEEGRKRERCRLLSNNADAAVS